MLIVTYEFDFVYTPLFFTLCSWERYSCPYPSFTPSLWTSTTMIDPRDVDSSRKRIDNPLKEKIDLQTGLVHDLLNTL